MKRKNKGIVKQRENNLLSTIASVLPPRHSAGNGGARVSCVRQYSTVSIDCCHRRLCVLAPFSHKNNDFSIFARLHPGSVCPTLVCSSRLFSSKWHQRYFWQDCCLLKSFSPPIIFAFTFLCLWQETVFKMVFPIRSPVGLHRNDVLAPAATSEATSTYYNSNATFL